MKEAKQTIAKHFSSLSATGFQTFRALECVDNKNKLPKYILYMTVIKKDSN